MNVCRRAQTRSGFSLVEVVIAVAILLTAFAGIFGALRASVELVSVSKARSGAIALANEQLEILRSLSYDDVGTIAGIPSGTIAQNATTTLNGIEYGIRTLIQYVDAPQDGTGAGDANTITADYKVAKVDVTWNVRERLFDYELVTNIVPRGIETLAGGGTLTINVIDALGAGVDAADVRVVNNTTTSTIDVTVSSNASGTATFPGAPAASDYELTVTKAGYSRAETYSATTSLPNPNPGHVSVTVGDTTTMTFAIDQFAAKTINTFEPIGTSTYADSFGPGEGWFSSTTNIEVTGGELRIFDPGTGYSTATASAETIDIAATQNLYYWDELRFTANTPASTSVRVRVFDDNRIIIPDGVIPNNSIGFTAGPVDLSGVSTTTYPTLRIFMDLKTEDASTTPAFEEIEVDFAEGPVPLPNVAFNLRGTKTIGTDGGAQPVYKVDADMVTDGNGTIATTTLEWDSYEITVDGASTSLDIASICPPQPAAISPNTSVITDIILVPDTTNTLLVTVRNNVSSYVSDAAVRLHRTAPAYDVTQRTGACGQTLFTNVPIGTVGGGNSYDVDVTATGYTADAQNNVEVNGVSGHNVTLNP